MLVRICLLSIILLPHYSLAQDTKLQNSNHRNKSTNSVILPPWAAAQQYDATAHVYFPDYYTFYDPARGGYLYWDKNNFIFSSAVPAFLEKVDLSKSRIKILKGLSLDLHPELNYPYYMQLYPANSDGNTTVPVPIPGNPAGN
jgi:hypothetical protein